MKRTRVWYWVHLEMEQGHCSFTCETRAGASRDFADAKADPKVTGGYVYGPLPEGQAPGESDDPIDSFDRELGVF